MRQHCLFSLSAAALPVPAYTSVSHRSALTGFHVQDMDTQDPPAFISVRHTAARAASISCPAVNFSIFAFFICEAFTCAPPVSSVLSPLCLLSLYPSAYASSDDLLLLFWGAVLTSSSSVSCVLLPFRSCFTLQRPAIFRVLKLAAFLRDPILTTSVFAPVPHIHPVGPANVGGLSYDYTFQPLFFPLPSLLEAYQRLL